MRRQGRLRTIASIVLAWYVLLLGASVASATAGVGSAFTMVCSADGDIRWVPTGQDEGQPRMHAGGDCPLCATGVAPPPVVRTPGAGPATPRSRVASALLSAPSVLSSAPPLPSRGPPTRVLPA